MTRHPKPRAVRETAAVTYNVHDAKTQLSKLLERVEQGEEVIIARAGVPVARLVRETPPGERALGIARGEMWIAEDFDAPLPEDVLADFEQ
ncbi:MAG TPA: type II toxin-antitoxin system prevent-host-death family antitoxin [Gemmatimonadaceae bacterium]|nr:type II toxin-antitoxin system prevent-host-death family antitoxin [Gemmatimonadaceae bacterium]